MSTVAAGDGSKAARIRALRSRGQTEGLSDPERKELLAELLTLYEQLDDSEEKAMCRQAFLLGLRNLPEICGEDKFSAFILESVTTEDIAAIEWETLDALINLSEALYSFEFSDSNLHIPAEYVRELLRHGLHQFEQSGDFETMFRLMERIPLPADMRDIHLLRLQNRLKLYEVRRIQRNRRLLYLYLAIQAVLVILVFPYLFIWWENDAIRQAIAETEQATTTQESQELLSYVNGVYWSIITASGVGYGDITPATGGGKALAALLGTLGVLTVGIVAGLVLSWITPRRLDR